MRRSKMGDRVKLIGSRQPGEIIEIKKDQFLLAIGALTTWATRDKFIPAESLHGDQGTPKGKARGGVKEPDGPKETVPATAKIKTRRLPQKRKKRRNRSKLTEMAESAQKRRKKPQNSQKQRKS